MQGRFVSEDHLRPPGYLQRIFQDFDGSAWISEIFENWHKFEPNFQNTIFLMDIFSLVHHVQLFLHFPKLISVSTCTFLFRHKDKLFGQSPIVLSQLLFHSLVLHNFLIWTASQDHQVCIPSWVHYPAWGNIRLNVITGQVYSHVLNTVQPLRTGFNFRPTCSHWWQATWRDMITITVSCPAYLLGHNLHINFNTSQSRITSRLLICYAIERLFKYAPISK